MISVSVSVVAYNPDIEVLDKVFHCLNSAFEIAWEKLRATFLIYVVNNGSNDEYAKLLPELLDKTFFGCSYVKYELVNSGRNLGYGGANNLVIDKTFADYHLILNPDVFVEEDTLLQALEYMEKHEQIGLLSPAVFGEDGERHYLCKRNPTLFIGFLRSFAPKLIKKFFAQRMQAFEMRECDYNQEMLDIPFLTGCFMLFRNSILKSLEGFDERFFMYYEDADIGRRLLEISHSAYVPTVKIVHKWTRGSHNDLRLKWITVKSAFIYWWKWGGVF